MYRRDAKEICKIRSCNINSSRTYGLLYSRNLKWKGTLVQTVSVLVHFERATEKIDGEV